ncbi:uncharacterized protein PAC_02807 [Phialocephala subalpina]|uniref:NAD(P)-binding domain-containing protein n=1 Tax=Phialocephala subalpina TaxID=576137 RepID=A0A1L7WJH2_9HELO|nr:uncharacterized protein PAC_02807 [Phialocephala subalpina]
MRVLVLGVTGRVGSRLIPALLAHKHEVVAYVRTVSKISPKVTAKLNSVVVGVGTDSAGIKAAILSNNCDAVVNAAGLAPFTSLYKKGPLPDIFAAVVKAAVDAREERGGPALRCWFMSGWSLLDSPKQPHMIMDYIPLYPVHKRNLDLIKTHSTDEIAWSLFCASNMPPKYDTPQYPRPTIISSPSSSIFRNVGELRGFIAADLEKGLQSELAGKRVGVKEKAKASQLVGMPISLVTVSNRVLGKDCSRDNEDEVIPLGIVRTRTMIKP